MLEGDNLNGIVATPDGKTLIAVQGNAGDLSRIDRLNQIAVIRLSKDLSSGTVQELIKSEDFDVPTTVARIGSRLYLPQARFTTPRAAGTEY